MEGRDFLVVPMVILTEGVHRGSDGPLYYPKEELAKTPAVWNHKPIVVYHPEMNGVGISACDPVVITNRKVGVMMNTKFENGRLKSEAWIEAPRANLVDPRIMAAIETNQMMEVSTGVFVDHDPTEGTWGAEEYQAIARNYRPDHLALLPDQIGACSIKDGAGLLRNVSADRKAKMEVAFKKMMEGFSEADRSVMEAVFKKMMEGSLSSGDGESFIGNQQTKTIKPMEKKALVDAIITKNVGWAETDREKLMALSEDQLKTISAPPVATPAANKETALPVVLPVVTTNTPAPAAKVVTVDSYISEAPKEVADVLRNSLGIYNEEKSRLVEEISANKQNSFTKEDLNSRPLNELRAIARLAGGPNPPARPAPSYAGQAPVIDNAEAEEAMEIPAINFAAAK
jgi:hypothetical protein